MAFRVLLVHLGEFPGADAGEQRAAHHHGCGELVREGDQEEGIGEQCGEVGELCASVLIGGADRVLHEAVRGQDEHRRDGAAECGQIHGQVVQRTGQLIPTEDPHADEHRFEEEGDQGFERQRGAEDIADEAGVFRPVHAELKLLHDAGDHAGDEVDEEELGEEFGEAQPLVVLAAYPAGLQNCNHPAGADGHRHEEEVVDSRDSELPTREYLCVHDPKITPKSRGKPNFSRPRG